METVFHVGRGISDRLAGKGLRIDEVKVQETWFPCVLGFCAVVPLYGNGVAKVRGRQERVRDTVGAVTCTESWTEINSAA